MSVSVCVCLCFCVSVCLSVCLSVCQPNSVSQSPSDETSKYFLTTELKIDGHGPIRSVVKNSKVEEREATNRRSVDRPHRPNCALGSRAKIHRWYASEVPN